MIREEALHVLHTLEKHGYQAYFVGGCVRDWLLHRDVHDIDICTNAHPSDVMRLFPHTVPTGLKHGTVTVIRGNFRFEVTTFRTEADYHDYRRPGSVIFVQDIRDDLARRDFTVNAMAMDKEGTLVDPFGGREDLAAGVIRAVGEADARFREDALRILRAARFAAKLNFAVEDATKQAMSESAPLLAHIAVERVRDELNKLVDSVTPETGVAVLVETALLAPAYPDLARLFERALPEVWRLPLLDTLEQKWSLLFYAAQVTPGAAQEICRRLKWPNREKNRIVRLAEALEELRPAWDQPAKMEWRRWLLRRGWPFCREFAAVLDAVWRRKQQPTAAQELAETYRQMPVKSLKELAVTGDQLAAALNRPPGAWIKRTLQRLWEQTALHGLPNTPDALFEAARREGMSDEHQTGNFEGVSE